MLTKFAKATAGTLAIAGLLAATTFTPPAAAAAPTDRDEASAAQLAGARKAPQQPGAQAQRGAKVPVRKFPHSMGGPTILYDNGPLVTHPGGGFGGADASALQGALGMTLFGFGHQTLNNNSMADDFVVPPGETWDIDTITFFGYQTGSTTTSTITEVRVQIWDGPPNAGGTIIYGDLTTNRLASTTFSNIYRVTDTTLTNNQRPVMEVVANINTSLDEGTYWVQWQENGTLASGPWAPPITILGQTTTGNGLQNLNGVWGAALDGAFPQGLPFVVEGTSGGNGAITLNKTVGTVPAVCATTDSVTVASGTTVYFCYEVENTGGVTFEFHDLDDDQLGSLLNDEPITLAPGATHQHIESAQATATVTNTGTWTAADALAGYQFDNTVANGFQDISGTGTALNLTDDGTAPVTMPWTFELYGNPSTQLCVSNNGNLAHGSATCSGAFTNEALPSATLGGAAIVPYWDDLDEESGNVYHQSVGVAPNRSFIVQWHQRPHFPGPNANTVTFQAVLRETSNEIDFYYQDTTFGDPATNNGASATVGVQMNATVANQYSFNTPASIPDTEAINVALGTVTEATASDTATVNIADPDISVDPTSLSSDQGPDTQVTQQLDIDNNGIGDLEWDITESSARSGDRVILAPGRQELVRTKHRSAPPASEPLREGTREFSRSTSGLAGKSITPVRPEVPDGTITITHSTTQNIVALNSVACNAGGLHTDNSYIRRFDLAAFGITSDFDVVQVEVGVEQAIGAGGDQPVTVNLYTWNPADPFTFANFDPIGSATVNIPDQNLTLFTVPVTGTAPANSTMVVEFFTPNGQVEGNSFFIGSNPDGQTDASFIAAADCGVAEPTDLAVIGFPGMHIVMNVSGTAGCNEDLPWVSATPSSGTTAPGGTSTVDVTFDSTGLTVGTALTGSLCVNSNDPDTGTLLVPIALNVVEDTMPFFGDFEEGDFSEWSFILP